jgi:phage-related protein
MAKEPSEEEQEGEKRSRPLRWLHGEIKTPPFSAKARKEAGDILRYLQDGKSVKYPHIEALAKTVGPRCGAVRVKDEAHEWRIMYRLDSDRLLIVEVYAKKSRSIPDEVIARCKKRLKIYDDAKAAHAKKGKNDGR